jgi:single-stranded-DNA-specific exonuclease
MAEARPRIVRRIQAPGQLPQSLSPVLRRVYAGRGLTTASELSLALKQLLPPQGLLGIDAAAELLADAIAADDAIVIAGDYDADGATAVALAMLGLRALGARHLRYVVPNRFTMGYGLSPAVAELAAAVGGRLLVTVDNGIASVAGVAAAQRLGMRVLITDHHLPGPELPAAEAIVNPNQPGCGFASKALAGVGVMFYVLVRLRALLRARGAFAGKPEPSLAEGLDLVALGTVADVARLDHNNRILIAHGLERIRSGRCRPGLRALLRCAGRDPARLTAEDLGFVLGPRINAAGRLEDIRIGIECLLAETEAAAEPLAQALEQINAERRQLMQDMTDEALLHLDVHMEVAGQAGICLFEPHWHEGVVGLVASKVKERHHRPTIAFAPSQEGDLLKGSARSIPALHIRDALAAVDAAHPGLIERYGGHAMAAGLSLKEDQLERFSLAFDQQCRRMLDAQALASELETDGELAADELQLAVATQVEQAGPWGQGFPAPSFDNCFEVIEARAVGSEGRHIQYRLRLPGGTPLSAIDFGGHERICASGRIRAVYGLSVNRFRGEEQLDLRLHYLEPAK